MKSEHGIIGTILLVGVGIAVLVWWTSGAASNCSFFETITGKCGAS